MTDRHRNINRVYSLVIRRVVSHPNFSYQRARKQAFQKEYRTFNRVYIVNRRQTRADAMQRQSAGTSRTSRTASNCQTAKNKIEIFTFAAAKKSNKK